MFGCYSSSNYDMLLQDCPASAAELMIESETTESIDCTTYFESLIGPDGIVSDEISAPI